MFLFLFLSNLPKAKSLMSKVKSLSIGLNFIPNIGIRAATEV